MIWVVQVTLFVDGSIRWSRPPPVEYTAVPSEARMSGHCELDPRLDLAGRRVDPEQLLARLDADPQDPAATAMLTAAGSVGSIVGQPVLVDPLPGRDIDPDDPCRVGDPEPERSVDRPRPDLRWRMGTGST